jgi:hypothetical protein
MMISLVSTGRNVYEGVFLELNVVEDILLLPNLSRDKTLKLEGNECRSLERMFASE